jgi:hypothetical protein
MEYSRFLRALFQFRKRAAGQAAEFSRSRVELLSVIGAARLECGEPTAEAGELIRRQLGNSFGDFFDFHVAQYSTAEAWLSNGKRLDACCSLRSSSAFNDRFAQLCLHRGGMLHKARARGAGLSPCRGSLRPSPSPPGDFDSDRIFQIEPLFIERPLKRYHRPPDFQLRMS